MRQITLITPPASFRKWLKANQNLTGLNYRMLAGEPKDDLKQTLLYNQGFLCAYTELRLDTIKDCHIEHIIPQTQASHLDLASDNLLGCFPADGGDTSFGYGAPIKGGCHVVLGQNFISPYTGIPSNTFTFDSDGAITGSNRASQDTIALLKLDHPSLNELRSRAIQVHGLSLRRRNLRSKRSHFKPLSATQAKLFAQKVMTASSKGQLEPFCTALAQVAEKYAQQEEQRAKRLKKRKER